MGKPLWLLSTRDNLLGKRLTFLAESVLQLNTQRYTLRVYTHPQKLIYVIIIYHR